MTEQPFNAVVLDLSVSSGIDGKETIKRLIEIDSAIKAIISSGFSTDPVIIEYKEYGFTGVIIKPYGIEELDKVLQSIVSSDI